MCLDVVTGVFGADEAHPLSEGSLRTCLEQRLAHSTAQNILYMDRDRTCTELAYALRHVIADPAPRRQGGWSTTDAVGETSGGARCLQVQPLRPLLHHLRWRKSDAEIAAMRRSVATGAAAVRACIAATQPGIGEHALAALYEFHVKAKGGATALAFPPVVGGGANACTVHYRHADSLLQDGEVVLMDAGAEVGLVFFLMLYLSVGAMFPILGGCCVEQNKNTTSVSGAVDRSDLSPACAKELYVCVC